LGNIVYEIYIVSGNLVVRVRFYVEIIQYVGCFTNRVQETKILM